MQLTKNFNLSEFASNDGGEFTLEAKLNLEVLSKQLQIIRNHFGRAIQINSGYRSKEHNKAIGGASNSYHVKGMAADMRIEGVSPKALHGQIQMLIDAGKIMQGGLGLYDSFVHYDIRGHLARWNFSTK
jgi:uncharacterized protein YcbK (DUF882 family)